MKLLTPLGPLAWVFASLLAIAGCGDDQAASTRPGGGGGGGAGTRRECCDAPGDYDLAVTVAGYVQVYRLHVPPGLEAGAPVVLQLHGAAGSMDKMVEVTGLTRLADREGFVVVTPFGFSPNGESGFWNAGACCGASAVDHVETLSRVVDEVLELVPSADLDQVYVAGQSNGAMMAYRMACEASEKLRGVVVNAGYLAHEDLRTSPPTELFTCSSYTPVSILAMHGLEDPLVRHEGSAQSPSLEEDIDAWRIRNACAEEGAETTMGAVRRRTWTCEAGTTIEFITIADHGHPWPGSPPETASAVQGPLTDQLDATEEFGRFVGSLHSSN